MEWLINRRRMMYNKATPPAYVTFEDNDIWKNVCRYYGDYNETVITDNGNNTVNIVTTFKSVFGTTSDSAFTIKKSIVIDEQTNVDNSGGTYTAGTTREAVGITMKQIKAVTANNVMIRASTDFNSNTNIGGTHRFEEFQYFTGMKNGSVLRAANIKYEHIKFPCNMTFIDFYTDWAYSMILDFPSTLTTITSYFGVRIRTGVTIIFRSATPPSIASSQLAESYQKKIAKMYVPSASLTDYQTMFNYITDRIEAIEGSDYEVFNAWEYDDD